MILTDENYFSKEAQLEYMGVSQFKSFDKCEASGLAEVTGEYEREKTIALLVGSYVDAHFEGTLDVFKAKNPELFTLKGVLKSEFKKADEIISRIERDELFMKFLDGKKQVIKTGKIENIPVKIKIDALHPKMIVDLKVMRDFEPMWKDGQRMTFIEAWGYDLQGAVYQAIEGNNKPFIIAGATKEPEINIELFSIPQEFLDERLKYFKSKVKHFDDIKKGLIEPIRCEKCDYCKRTKKLTSIIDLRDLIYDME